MTTNELPREPRRARPAGRRRPRRRPPGVRRTGPPDLRRHLHARAAPHGPRGGRTRRGAGDLPPCLEGPATASVATRNSPRGCTASPRTPPTPRSSAAGATAPTSLDAMLEEPIETPHRGRSPRTSAESRPRSSRGSSVALEQLPPKLRVLVVLKDVYGLSHEEIAEELGISVAAAKVRLHRGRKRLRDLLYDDDAEDDGRRTTMQCDDVATLLPEAVDSGAAVELSVQRHIETLPALPGRARPLPPDAPRPPAAAHPLPRARARACSRRRSPRSRRPASARPSARSSRAAASPTPAPSAVRRSPPAPRPRSMIVHRSRRRAAPRHQLTARSVAPGRRLTPSLASGAPAPLLSLPFRPDRARRAVAQLVEHRSPKPAVGGSSPSCPAANDDLTRASEDGAAVSMNRQTKRMMAKQGTDKPKRRAASKRRPAAAAPNARRSARASTSARSRASCARSRGPPRRKSSTPRSSCSSRSS